MTGPRSSRASGSQTEENTHRTLDRIMKSGMVPVDIIDDPDEAPALIGAPTEGGLPIAATSITRTAVAAATRARGHE